MKKYYLVAFALFATACANNISDYVETTNSEVPVQYSISDEEGQLIRRLLSNNHLTIDEARIELASMGKGMTRSESNNTYRVLTKENTGIHSDSIHAILPDTLAYIMYHGDRGFSIISSDNRVSKTVIANVENGDIFDVQGNLLEDSLSKRIIAYVINYMEKEICGFEMKRDSIWQLLQDKIGIADNETRSIPAQDEDDIYYYYDMPDSGWETDIEYGPMLTTEWGQGTPYNMYVRDKIEGGSALTGCTATATAQIVAYWGYPAQIDSTYFDWNVITEYEIPITIVKSQVAMLMKYIGEGIKTVYTPEGSSATLDDTVDWLNNNGYQCDDIGDYNYSNVCSSIQNGNPVLIRGEETPEEAHCWVIDGWRTMKRLRRVSIYIWNHRTGQEVFYNSYTYYEYRNDIHNNWGSDGYCNGWFVPGCFDLDDAVEYDSPKYNNANFNPHNDVEIVTNIRPQIIN